MAINIDRECHKVFGAPEATRMITNGINTGNQDLVKLGIKNLSQSVGSENLHTAIQSLLHNIKASEDGARE